VIVWRFTGWRLLSQAAEERAQKLVAIQFFLLAPYVAFEAVHKLVTGEQPATSWLGIALVTSSVIGMPFLGIAKRRLADKLGSVATRGEGTQNLLCAYLAGAVLVSLLGNALFGFWWLDPAAALVVAAVAVKEGRESWRGEGCCVAC
jgi:divalent metal cation (Fe/Co/Zn/Cd) transporter